MSSAEILSLISTISFVVAAVSFALAVFLWFYFKIPAVIGDLSGRTAKKSIARIRTNNERAGGQGYRPSTTNADRGMLTDTMKHSRKLNADAKKQADAEQKIVVHKVAQAKAQSPETELLEENKANVQTTETELLDKPDGTELLVNENETAPLMEETIPLTEETAPLTEGTTLLAQQSNGKKLVMLDDIMLIHTDEVIL